MHGEEPADGGYFQRPLQARRHVSDRQHLVLRQVAVQSDERRQAGRVEKVHGLHIYQEQASASGSRLFQVAAKPRRRHGVEIAPRLQERNVEVGISRTDGGHAGLRSLEVPQ